MNKKPYSDRRWYDADIETMKKLKPLKHSPEYKVNAIKFLNELHGKEMSEEEIPEALRLTEEEKEKLRRNYESDEKINRR
ncbi:hypothetical protein FC40_GL000031 [Ligilactobacillus hayakitensis DSM 18933 = JCM 14209]|uniref:Uncharacterized protein n=1 Tax=Ligilactobacillus hayakitensis DSM 18933 = JCM 14209 TaxID=1423755 RepID=A0A0R1WNM6_9LACO|nr:hypothetical protein [Ligilactobacillus hayakitensis]KRM19488.1 hypothetical protein FC40_GL000031 [Ligilactobacillus hayakitensis DSM 18933 = JCM 14209]